MRLFLPIILATVLIQVVATEESSRQLNIGSFISSIFCFLYGSPVAFVFIAFDTVCLLTSRNSDEDNDEFDRARATLASTIYFTKEEVDDVNVRYCSLFDFTEGTAFATNEKNVWFPADLRGEDDLTTATQLAHQMGHVRQYKRDFWEFKCEYFQELLRTGFSFDRDNEVELEAFELEDKFTECITENNCVP